MQGEPAVYFQSLTIEDVKCFKGEHSISFQDKNENPNMCTVLLGENGVGKTTILRVLASLHPINIGNNRITPLASHYSFSETYKYNLGDFKKVSAKLYTDNDKRISAFATYEKDSIPIRKHDWGYYHKEKIISEGFFADWFLNFVIYGYGINRKTSNAELSEDSNKNNIESLFSDKVELLNIEEWLLQLELRKLNGARDAAERLERIRELIFSKLLPDVNDFRFSDNGTRIFVEFQTPLGWVVLKDLGYGYQACLAWMLDFAKRMMERYPNAENPLHEPAIVLVDEIDLHLHPEWQRKILSTLLEAFPQTQFIVSAHSPLVIQSTANINLVIIQKENAQIHITQPDIPSLQGWTVEEILSELMGLNDRIYSEKYLLLMTNFNEALDENNPEKAQKAFDSLMEILHPDSPQRKLLRMQIADLTY